MVEFILEGRGGSITLPINPSNLLIDCSGNNKVSEIVGATNIVVARRPNLARINISSYFPKKLSRADQVKNVLKGLSAFSSVIPSNTALSAILPRQHEEVSGTAMSYVEFIQKAWERKKPLKFTVTGVDEESMLVVIDKFNYERRGGEHEDIYYNLELVEYKEYGAKTVQNKVSTGGSAGTEAVPCAPVRSTYDKPEQSLVYKLSPNDTLVSIAMKQSGSSQNWLELYELNKSIFGSNPANLPVGQSISIPQEWLS